jgi:hypothetical protein
MVFIKRLATIEVCWLLIQNKNAVLKFIFDVSVPQQIFRNLWKQAAVVPEFSNYRPTSVLNNFSKVSELINHDNFSHFLKSKTNPSQHVFTQF